MVWSFGAFDTVIDHLMQAANDSTPTDTQTLVSSSFLRNTFRSTTSSGQDIPSLYSSQTLRFPTSPENQCVIMNVLTVSIKRDYLIGHKKVKVESKGPTKDFFLQKYIPFGRASWSKSSSKAPSLSRHASSSLSKQRDHAEAVEETVIQSYPVLDDQVGTCVFYLSWQQPYPFFLNQDIYSPSRIINDYILQKVFFSSVPSQRPLVHLYATVSEC